MGRISTVAAAYLGLGKNPKATPRADSTSSTSSTYSTSPSPSTPAPPTPPPPPPTTPSHAAPRRLPRTLSFRGGDDVTEALHIELEHSLLQVVDMPIEKKKQATESAESQSSTSTITPTSPSACRFALAKPALSTHHSTQAGEEFNRPLTSLDPAQGPYVLGDGVCHATFSLFPLLEDLSMKSRKTLLQSLLDPSPTKNLEKAGRINWHPECASLVALRTESDGNCLAHAASLGCWGVHDRKLLLRNAVRSFLVEGGQGQGQAMTGGKRLLRLIRKSWEEELGKHGVELGKEALDAEWAVLAKQAENGMMVDGLAATTGNNNNNDKQEQQPKTPQSPQSPVQSPQQQQKDGKKDMGSFAYLEAAHIYILAHVLRRPLIVFATDWVDAKGRQLASAEEIAGVYLPLELPRHVCSRTPLVLAYDSFHFSPLVPADPSRLSQVPLVTSSAQRDRLLPLPFYAPSERNKPLRTAVLKHYLDCETLMDGVLVVKIDGDSGGRMPMVGHATSSPFSASSFPADGLLSLLLSNVVEDEEFRQNGTILFQGRSLCRSASASAMAMLASSSSSGKGLPSSSSSSSLSSKQRLRGGGASAASTPPRPLSLGSFASSSSRNGSSNSLNAQLQQQQQQQQQRQQQRELREQQEQEQQQMYKSASCSALGSRATIPKKSSSSSSSSSSSIKRQQSLVRALREHKDLVLALEDFLKKSKEAERQQQQKQQQTSAAPSPTMTAITPPATPLSGPPALLLAAGGPGAETVAPAPTRPSSHNWLAALPLP